MKNIIKNSNEANGLIKLALIVVLILILGILFLNTWVYDYNTLLRFSFVMKGNIFVMFVYMILLYIFMIIFDCNNISTHQTMLLIISEILSVIFCNVIVYLVVIIPAAATGFLPFMPIVILTIKDIIVIFLWSLLTINILRKLCPPKKLLLISNDTDIDDIIHKTYLKVNESKASHDVGDYNY